jgi:DNA-binding CsgD family transcriptional regulator
MQKRATIGGFLTHTLDHASHCRSLDEFRAELLAGLCDLVGCDGALLRPGARWTDAAPLYHDESGPRFTDAYVTNRDRYAPELTRWCALANGHAPIVDTMTYSSLEQGRLAVYSEVLRPSKIRSILALPLSHRAQIIGLIFLFRKGSARPFNADHVALTTPLTSGLSLADWAVSQTFPTRPTPAPAPQASRVIERFRLAHQALGAREKQVAALIAQGLSSKEIANLLGTSMHTVRAQTTCLFRKLAVHSRVDLARWLHQTGLMPLPSGAQAPSV